MKTPEKSSTEVGVTFYQRGWDDGYRLGFETQPDMNRQWLRKRVEVLEGEVAHYRSLIAGEDEKAKEARERSGG